MKKLTAILCAAAMTLGMVSTAFANPSIADLNQPEEQVTVAPESAEIIPEGKRLVVQEADVENYEKEDVVEVVKRLNDEKEMITMEEMMDILKVMEDENGDPIEEIKTNKDNVINPLEYEPITKFADLVLTDGTTVEYDIDGEIKGIKATVKAEAAKDAEKEDLLIMQIDPKTGDVYFIEVEDYDPETGEITATFACLGPFTILEKIAE